MSIEDRLKDVMITTQPEEIPRTVDEAIPDIIQAFQEEGWIPLPPLDAYRLRQPRAVLMSGQDWYDRFMAQPLDETKPIFWKDIKVAARKASGLE